MHRYRNFNLVLQRAFTQCFGSVSAQVVMIWAWERHLIEGDLGQTQSWCLSGKSPQKFGWANVHTICKVLQLPKRIYEYVVGNLLKEEKLIYFHGGLIAR